MVSQSSATYTAQGDPGSGRVSAPAAAAAAGVGTCVSRDELGVDVELGEVVHQGLTLVHSSAQRKHLLLDAMSGFSVSATKSGSG